MAKELKPPGTLREQIVEDRVAEVMAALSLPPDDAFARLAHSIITGQSIHAFDQADFVDGGQDKQIDLITIDEKDDEATIHLIQAKGSPTFSSNVLIQMSNGLRWVFQRNKNELQTLTNKRFKDKIRAVRNVQSNVGPSNMHLLVTYACKGPEVLSDEYKQEAETIRRDYDNGTFASFELRSWGAETLVEQINMQEKATKKIDCTVKMRYDTNNPSIIKYQAHGINGAVCSAPADEIARIVNEDKLGAIFDSNLRRFRGSHGTVNADIRSTCSGPEGHVFWFLNNGITVACDSFDVVQDPDDPHVIVKNMQIVNGCQTATTLAQAAAANQLSHDAYVLLRIYQTQDDQFVSRIVLATNNQNKITERDLRSNDHVQINMEPGFRKYGLHYERKPRQYDKSGTIVSASIAPNEIVGQSYLAIVMRVPSDARRRKYKVWGQHYDAIFCGKGIERHVIGYLLFRATECWLERSGKTKSKNEVTRRLANNAAYHIARIAAFIWRDGDVWTQSVDVLEKQIKTLKSSPVKLQPVFEKAFRILTKLIRADRHYNEELDIALKSYDLDADINKYLHTTRPKIKT